MLKLVLDEVIRQFPSAMLLEESEDFVSINIHLEDLWALQTLHEGGLTYCSTNSRNGVSVFMKTLAMYPTFVQMG